LPTAEGEVLGDDDRRAQARRQIDQHGPTRIPAGVVDGVAPLIEQIAEVRALDLHRRQLHEGERLALHGAQRHAAADQRDRMARFR